MAEQGKNKRLPAIIGIVAGAAIIVLLAVFLPQVFNLGVTDTGTWEVEKPDTADKGDEGAMAEELEQILGNDRFMDTLSCFYYPGSKVKSYRQIEDEGDFFYILLETEQNFNQVEEFYGDKRVQSIWSKSELYERSFLDFEQQFLEEENTAPTSKHTYHSTDKDKVVNVLVNSIDDQATEVMVIYWEH
ncbi:MAG: hypothetical protein ACQEP5_04505 [Actinomycetota bacterium]